MHVCPTSFQKNFARFRKKSELESYETPPAIVKPGRKATGVLRDDKRTPILCTVWMPKIGWFDRIRAPPPGNTAIRSFYSCPVKSTFVRFPERSRVLGVNR